MGWGVPHFWSICWRVLKNTTSLLKGDWNSLSQFFR